MADKTPTLKSMNYDASPPRCFNCKHRFTDKAVVKSKTTRTMMCALAQEPVRTSSVCDSWLGYKGEALEPPAIDAALAAPSDEPRLTDAQSGMHAAHDPWHSRKPASSLVPLAVRTVRQARPLRRVGQIFPRD